MGPILESAIRFFDAHPLSHAAVMLMIALAMAAMMRSVGLLSERDFDAAPLRIGRIGVGDMAVGLGLWIIFPIAGVSAYITGHGEVDRHDPQTMLMVMLLSQIGAVPAVLFIVFHASRSIEGGIGNFGFGLRRLPGGVTMGLGCLAIMIPIMMLAGTIAEDVRMWVEYTKPIRLAHELLPLMRDAAWGPVKLGLIVSAVVVAPILEEIVFRGLLQTSLLNSGLIRNRWGIIAIVSAVFAVIHLGGIPWYALPVLFVLSLGLGYAYERSGSLYASILMHALFNAIQVTLALNLQDE